MNRNVRYQGAIIRENHILLLRQRIFPTGKLCWIFPGGEIEPGETEEECVRREMKEETNLDVKVKELLFDDANLGNDIYDRGVLTYRCEVLSGDAKPGYDPENSPEIEAAGLHGIIGVKWFDLRSEKDWDLELVNDPIIYLPLQRIRRVFHYLP